MNRSKHMHQTVEIESNYQATSSLYTYGIVGKHTLYMCPNNTSSFH